MSTHVFLLLLWTFYLAACDYSDVLSIDVF
jgi:hypothetical protein